MPSDIQQAAGLSDYAVASRYPGISEPVEAEEYREAVELAEAVVSWAEQAIGQMSLDSIHPPDSSRLLTKPDIPQIDPRMPMAETCEKHQNSH